MPVSRPTLVIAAFGAIATSSVTIGAAAGTERESKAGECFGREATIVADSFHVEGTDDDDVIVDPEGGALIEAGAGDDRICARGDDSEVYGAGGDDLIAGTPEEDRVYPGAGDDLVDSFSGNDLLTDVDRGDDVYRAGGGIDLIRFSAPGARLQRPVRVDLARHEAGGHGHDRLDRIEMVEGTGKPDVLRGDDAANWLDGVRGGDRIFGADGADTIVGAAVLVTEAGTADRYDGSDPALRGGADDDHIFGGAGRDRLSGGPGADVLDGGGPHRRPGDGGDGGAGRDRCRDLEAARDCER